MNGNARGKSPLFAAIAELISGATRFIKLLVWDSLVLYIVRLAYPPQQGDTRYPSIGFWLVSSYLALHALAVGFYENRLDRLENRLNALIAQTGGTHYKRALARVADVQDGAMLPSEPRLGNPWSAVSTFAKGEERHDASVNELRDLVRTFSDDLTAVELAGADLKGVDLINASLSDANLYNANLEGANLEGAILRGTNLIGANLNGANLGLADLTDAALDRAYLDDADLSGATLSSADLVEASLRNANLFGTDLVNANLRGADLRGTYSIAAVFTGADLIDADLEGADLLEAVFSDAYLRGANLTGIRIKSEKPTDEWCRTLRTAQLWEDAYRSDILACGSTIPAKPNRNRPESGIR